MRFYDSHLHADHEKHARTTTVPHVVEFKRFLINPKRGNVGLNIVQNQTNRTTEPETLPLLYQLMLTSLD